jgi:hypothetical protein
MCIVELGGLVEISFQAVSGYHDGAQQIAVAQASFPLGAW